MKLTPKGLLPSFASAPTTRSGPVPKREGATPAKKRLDFSEELRGAAQHAPHALARPMPHTMVSPLPSADRSAPRRAEGKSSDGGAPAPAKASTPPTPNPAMSSTAGLAPTSAPAGSHEPFALPPVVEPHPLHEALLPLAGADPSLRLDVRPHLVHVAMETQSDGGLEVEVRVRDGKADVHFDGPASPLVAARFDELREVLAHEGVSLGEFSQGADQRGSERSTPEPPDPPVPSPPSVKVLSPARRHEGRIDVEA